MAASLYSASMVDKATVGYLLLHQETAPQPSLNKYPVVDRRVS